MLLIEFLDITQVTVPNLPNVTLIYEEKYPTLLETRRREAQLKGWSRAKKKALIKGDLDLLKNMSKKKIKEEV